MRLRPMSLPLLTGACALIAACGLVDDRGVPAAPDRFEVRSQLDAVEVDSPPSANPSLYGNLPSIARGVDRSPPDGPVSSSGWVSFCTVLVEIEATPFPTDEMEMVAVATVAHRLLEPYVPQDIEPEFTQVQRILEDALVDRDLAELEMRLDDASSAVDAMERNVRHHCGVAGTVPR